MATVLEITDGAPRDFGIFRELFLGPIQETACSTTLLRR